MMLKMYTGKVFVAQEFVDLYWADTMIGRKKILENVAAALKERYAEMVTCETVFFYEAESKMNRSDFDCDSSGPEKIERAVTAIAKTARIPEQVAKKAASRIPRPVRERPSLFYEPAKIVHPAGTYTNTDWSKKYMEEQ